MKHKIRLNKLISVLCAVALVISAALPTVGLLTQAASEKSTITFEAGEAFVMPISGTPNTNAELPDNVAIAGKTFEGWYKDPGFTQPAGDDYKFPAVNEVATLYAKMVITDGSLMTIDDMDTAKFLTNPGGGRYITSGCYSIAANEGVDGTKALKRSQFAGNTSQEKYTVLYKGDDFLKLSKNSVYKVSFSYKVETASADKMYACMLTASHTDHWLNYKRWVATTADASRVDGTPEMLAKPFDVSTTGTWLTHEFFVCTKDINANADSAFIGFQGASDSVVYFDNFEVVRVGDYSDTTAVVRLDYGFGGFGKTYVGTAGNAVTVEVPARDGYTLTGWVDYNTGAAATAPTVFTAGITQLTAQWSEINTDIITFDDMPDKYKSNHSGCFYTSGCFSYAAGKGVDNSVALKHSLATSTSNSDQLKVTALNIGEDLYEVTSNTSYLVSVRYKVETATSNKMLLSVVTSATHNHFEGRQQWPNGGVAINTTTASDEWQYAAFVVSTGALGTKDTLFFATQYGNDGVVYFDNVSISKLFGNDQGKGAVITNSLDGTEAQVYVGAVGGSVSIQEPERLGLEFKGWFSDEACTVAAQAPTVYPTGVVTLYAGWKLTNSKVVTFEDMPSTFMENKDNKYYTSGCYSIADGKGIGGSKALKRDIKNDGQLKATSLNDGAELLRVDSNTVYSVKFNYYIETKGSDLKVSIVTAGSQGHWSDTRKDDYPSFAVDQTAVGTWQTMEYYLSFGNLGTSNCAYFAMEGGTGGLLYVDNIEITKLFGTNEEKGMLVVDYGNGTVEKFVGNVGDPVTLNIPDRSAESMVLDGWYSDAEFTNSISAPATISKGVNFAYAKWKIDTENAKAVITFEDMPEYLMKNTGGKYYTSGCYSIADGKGIDGSKALKREMGSDSQLKPTSLNKGNNLLTVESNTAYLVKFSYYVEKKGAELTASLFTAGSGGHWSGTRKEWPEGGVNVDMSTTGTWQTMEFIAMTGSLGSSNSAYFAMQGVQSTVYIDNIEITPLFAKGENKGVVYIDYGNGTHETILGEGGAPVSAQLPTMSDDYRFEGWFTSSAYTDKTDAPTAVKAGQVVYAFAKFVKFKHTVTFEDMPAGLMISDKDKGIFTSSKCFSIGTGVGINGSKALVKAPETASKQQSLNDGDGIYRLGSNSRYKITVHYYFTAKSTAPKFGLLAAGATSSWEGRKTIVEGVAGVGTAGQWHSVTFIAKTGKLSRNGAYLTVANTTAEMYIDNIEISLLEEDEVVLEYKTEAIGESFFITGKPGEIISGVTPPKTSKNFVFGGWFADKDFTIKFDASVFPSEDMVIYGKMDKAPVTTVGFDDYPFSTVQGSPAFSASIMDIMEGRSSDGDGYCVRVDNRKEAQTVEVKKVVLNIDSSNLELENGKRYIVSYDLFIDTPGAGSASVSFYTSGKGNMWDTGKQASEGIAYTIGACPQKTWFTGHNVFTVDAEKGKTVLNFAISSPFESVICFDNIRVREITDSSSNVLIYTNAYGNAPDPVIAKSGTRIVLPKKLSGIPASKLLVGWRDSNYNTIESVILAEDMVATAMVALLEGHEDFEKAKYNPPLVVMGYDFDWEIYNSAKEGGVAENALSGTHSLHRIGDEHGEKIYLMQRNQQFSSNVLSAGVVYTIEMNVKIENPVHTLGAIEIAGSDDMMNPWEIEGDRRAIAAIADIADGSWHKVDFTFNASAEYLSIITPGNLSIYIDDITIKYAGEDAKESTDAIFKKYVAKKLNENGTYDNENVYALEEFTLKKRSADADSSSFFSEYATIIIIGIVVCAVVVVAAGALITVRVIRKRKAGQK